MAKKLDVLTLKPSKMIPAFSALMRTDRSAFMWGPPGIAKSQVVKQIATANMIAFIDLRLSQMEPTDLRGVPYPTEVCGRKGVRWSTPIVMPENLNLSWVEAVLEEETTFYFLNPLGANGIHYCTSPNVSVKAVGKGKNGKPVTAKIISQTLDTVTVALIDADGELTEGKIRINVSGEVRAILALEEFNSAAPSVQAAAYELVLDRRLGEYQVPNGVFIVGMGNRQTDKGVTYSMPTPIMNRFVHLEMCVDFEDWQTWALTNMVNADVVGFLSHFKQSLHVFDPSSASRGFETPRSWEFVSDILNAPGNEDVPSDVLLALFTGAVGDASAIQFSEVRKNSKDLPRVEDILSGKLTEMKTKVEVALSYMLVTSLCYELTNRVKNIEREKGKDFEKSKEFDQWLKEVDNFLSFMMENFQHEICVMGAKAAIAVHKLPLKPNKMKMFKEFSQKFKGLLLNNN